MQRHDYEGYEEAESSDSDILTKEDEEEEEEEDELRGRRHIRVRSRRSGRRLFGGRRGRRRRRLGRASTSRSRSPIAGGEGEGDDDGWVEDNNPPTIHPFTATPGLACPMPTTPLGFFQRFVSLELLLFFVEETNDYAYYQHRKCVKSVHTLGVAWV